MSTSKKNHLIWLVENCAQSAYILAIQIVGNTDDAKDIVQQSYKKVMQQSHVPQDSLELKPWFNRIVRNTAIDNIRVKNKWQKKRTILKQHIEQQQKNDSLDRAIEKSEQKQLLETCLKHLQPEQRELIVLRDYHDYSYQDIAKILDIAKGTVMSRLHRARLALRKKYQEFSNEGDL